MRCSDGPIECSVYNSTADGFDVECDTPDGHRALSFGFLTKKTEYASEDSSGCVDHTTRMASGDTWCIEHTFITRPQWQANRDAARRRGAIVDNLGSYSGYHCPGGAVEVLCMSATQGLVGYLTRSVSYEWQCGSLQNGGTELLSDADDDVSSPSASRASVVADHERAAVRAGQQVVHAVRGER